MKLGIIGCGNMAKAIVKGIIISNTYKNNQIIISDINKKQIEEINKDFKIKTTMDNNKLIKQSDVIILAIKPQYFEDCIKNITVENFENKLIVSIMAGTSIDKIRKTLYLGYDKNKDNVNCDIVRVMTNTPALVNEAMSVICFDESINNERKIIVEDIFKSIGKVTILNENQIDAVTAISGSSPAYVFMMIEAMADAGVLLGLSRQDAYILASQSIFGSAKLYLDTKIHPAILKDMVCSPSGTTIEALRILEKQGFRSSLIEAMISCEQKSKNMNKNN